jgi:glycosyltransferase involved in cell wall biosynthesis
MAKKITVSVHALIKNESRFAWYSIMSVMPYMDKVMIRDTGSTDSTPQIISEIQKIGGEKVDFESISGKFDEAGARQKMLEDTKEDWFIVVDADEIWWSDSIKKVVELINSNGQNLESIVVPSFNLVGDVFHYQEKAAGKYHLAGRTGHYSLRAINRKIPGLAAIKPHGQTGWADGEGRMIQDRNSRKIAFLDAPYLHATHLMRSNRKKDLEVIKRQMKLKYEIGIPFPGDFYYPEVFFGSRPKFVKSPWQTMSPVFKFIAFLETPFRKIKRRVWKGGVGY